MRKRNEIISRMRQLGYTARETFVFLARFGVDVAYDIVFPEKCASCNGNNGRILE